MMHDWPHYHPQSLRADVGACLRACVLTYVCTLLVVVCIGAQNMKKYFSFEVQVLDDKNVRRRFRASNYQVWVAAHS